MNAAAFFGFGNPLDAVYAALTAKNFIGTGTANFKNHLFGAAERGGVKIKHGYSQAPAQSIIFVHSKKIKRKQGGFFAAGAGTDFNYYRIGNGN